LQIKGTYHRTAQQNNAQRFNNARYANNPRQTNKEEDAEDVLYAGEVDAHHSTHFDRLKAVELSKFKEFTCFGALCVDAVSASSPFGGTV
jgi:hypothetical protein